MDNCGLHNLRIARCYWETDAHFESNGHGKEGIYWGWGRTADRDLGVGKVSLGGGVGEEGTVGVRVGCDERGESSAGRKETKRR